MFGAVLAVVLTTTSLSQIQIADRSTVESIRSRLPVIDAADWNSDLHSPDVMWYTEREMPRAYQHAGGFHSPDYNISADPTDSPIRHGEGGNANVQFPWRTAGGLDRSPNAITATGLLLPPRPAGGVWPVVVWRGTLPGHPGMGPEAAWRWVFPSGAILFEVIAHPVAGEVLTCEVRARLRTADGWSAGLFRPMPSAADLAASLEQIDTTRFAREIRSLRSPQEVSLVDVTDRANRSKPAYRGHAGVAFVPELPAEVVRSLLRRPFVECTGGEWMVGTNGAICYAPTSAADGQLVPRLYMASLIGSDSESCDQCHRTVANHARKFDRDRGWYGHVRGDDDTFSFHPVAPRTISYNGATLAPTLRQSLLTAGVIAIYDPSSHPREVYRPITTTAERRR